MPKPVSHEPASNPIPNITGALKTFLGAINKQTPAAPSPLHPSPPPLENPPINDTDRFRNSSIRFSSPSTSTWWMAGVRCQSSLPPKSKAASLPANGSRSSNQSGDRNPRSARRNWAINPQGLGSQRDIRQELIEADLADCMVDLGKITSTCHAWRGDELAQSRGGAENGNASETLRASAASREYSDLPGFLKSATTAEIAAHGHVLTPGRYVGAEEVADGGKPFEKKMPRLVAELHAKFAESAKLKRATNANLRGLGHGG